MVVLIFTNIRCQDKKLNRKGPSIYLKEVHVGAMVFVGANNNNISIRSTVEKTFSQLGNFSRHQMLSEYFFCPSLRQIFCSLQICFKMFSQNSYLATPPTFNLNGRSLNNKGYIFLYLGRGCHNQLYTRRKWLLRWLLLIQWSSFQQREAVLCNWSR